MVREPLIWLGELDPVLSMERARDMDPEQTAARDARCPLGSLPRLGQAIYGARDCTAGVRQDRTAEAPGIPRAVAVSVRCRRDQVDTKKLGQWLKRISGRLYDGHRIVPGQADKHDKVQRWMLNTAHDAGIAG